MGLLEQYSLGLPLLLLLSGSPPDRYVGHRSLHICTLVFFWIALTEGWIQFSREKEYLWERVFFFTYVRRSPINQRFFFFLILIHFSLSTMKTWILLWTLFIDFMEFGLLEKKEDRRTFSFHRLNEQGPLTSRFWRRSRFSKRKPIFLSNSLSL